MIVLDTHAWIWWVNEPVKLGRVVRREITRARKIGVPAVCCFELVTLVAHDRIRLDRPPLHWMQDALAFPLVELIPMTPAVAVKAAELPRDFPGDPADRLLTATAILESALLIQRLQDFNLVRTAW
jgi:PIN domain nuclease of toxin-antitoxin system